MLFKPVTVLFEELVSDVLLSYPMVQLLLQATFVIIGRRQHKALFVLVHLVFQGDKAKKEVLPTNYIRLQLLQFLFAMQLSAMCIVR